MRQPFRLLLTGSRTWDDTLVIEYALAAILARHPGGVLLVHGACPRGADAIAAAYASRTPGYRIEAHPVPVGRHDRSCRARTAVLRAHRPHYVFAGVRLVAHWSVSCAGDGDTRSLAACCWVSARSAASSACTPRVRWPPGREPSPLYVRKLLSGPGSPPPSLQIQAIPC